jgi:hypothetical protein
VPGVDPGRDRVAIGSGAAPIVPNGSSTPSTSRKTKAMAAHDNATERVHAASRLAPASIGRTLDPTSTIAYQVGEACAALRAENVGCGDE